MCTFCRPPRFWPVGGLPSLQRLHLVDNGYNISSLSEIDEMLDGCTQLERLELGAFLCHPRLYIYKPCFRLHLAALCADLHNAARHHHLEIQTAGRRDLEGCVQGWRTICTWTAPSTPPQRSS